MKKKSSVTYAKALFSCSVSADELQKQAESLKALADEVNTNDASADFFQNPFISLSAKKQILAKSLSIPSDTVLLNFLELLIQVKRFQELPGISEEFQNLINESKKTKEATLIFAETMDEQTINVFKEKLEKTFKTHLNITQKVNPEILGGFILIISGKIIDLSIKEKLNTLKERLYSKKI